MGTEEQPLVLLLDDDEFWARSLKRALGLRGLEVVTRHGIEDALAAVEQRRPDVCIVDYRLGDVDTGADFARALWARYQKRTPPLMLLSGTLDDVPIEDRRPFVAAHDKSLSVDAIVHELREALAHGNTQNRSHSRLRAMPRPDAGVDHKTSDRKVHESQ